jgi:hypothetical protein
MVLMRGVQNGTLYKLLVSITNNWCNSYVVVEGVNEEEKSPTISGQNTMAWHQRLGHIGEKGLRTLHGKGMI